ncbi:MAG: AlpA family transcriptional regulator, partial [Lautropia sp.]
RRILRLDEVEAKSGFKRAHIYNLMRAGKFPQALRLGVRAVGWCVFHAIADTVPV